MRFVYMGLIIVVTVVVLLFKVQNLTNVTISLFSMSATMPVSLLILGVYVLGMVTAVRCGHCCVAGSAVQDARRIDLSLKP
jgi:putative membrane protein